MTTERKQHTVSLITTNQIDIGIRTLSGVINENGGRTRLINLSSRESYFPYSYPEAVKNALAPLLKDCDVVGISVADIFFRRAQDLATWIKKEFQVKIIMGGIHAQLYPEECISTEGVDAVCIGEGIQTVTALLDTINWDDIAVDDFWLKGSNGSINKGKLLPLLTTEEILSISLPNYTYEDYWLLDSSQHKINLLKDSGGCFKFEQHQIGHPYSFVASFMWGCVNKCSYCNVTAASLRWKEQCPENKWFRIKPNNIVIEELKQIKLNNPNMRFMCIMDNDFSSRTTKQINEFFDYFKQEVKVPVYLMVSPNTLSEEKLQIMIYGGVREINMGIESNQDTNSQMYSRPIKDDIVIQQAEIINKYRDKVYPFYDLLIFNHEESNKSLLHTIGLVGRLPLPFDLVPHYLTLGPAVQLYKQFASEGRHLSRSTSKTTSSDFHDFNFDEYSEWETFYLNILLEWMGGPHNDDTCGRLPRTVGKFMNNAYFSNFVRKNNLVVSDTEDINKYLTSTLVMDLLKKDIDALKGINSSINKLIFTNQETSNG